MITKKYEEFLEKPINAINLPLGDMILNNGEILRDIPEFREAFMSSVDSLLESLENDVAWIS